MYVWALRRVCMYVSGDKTCMYVCMFELPDVYVCMSQNFHKKFRVQKHTGKGFAGAFLIIFFELWGGVLLDTQLGCKSVCMHVWTPRHYVCMYVWTIKHVCMYVWSHQACMYVWRPQECMHVCLNPSTVYVCVCMYICLKPSSVYVCMYASNIHTYKPNIHTQ